MCVVAVTAAAIGLSVGVTVRVHIGVRVGICVEVGVGVVVAVGLGVCVEVLVTVAVRVGVTVGSGMITSQAHIATTSPRAAATHQTRRSRPERAGEGIESTLPVDTRIQMPAIMHLFEHLVKWHVTSRKTIPKGVMAYGAMLATPFGMAVSALESANLMNRITARTMRS